MTHTDLNWTHTGIKIVDIRKLNKFYVIKIATFTTIPATTPQIESALFVKHNIFEERLKSYFLKDINLISRDEILEVKWNMYISKGYYIKVHESGDVEKFHRDSEKWYVSYLEIDGPLGMFCSIYRDEEFKDKETIK